ncbi:MAG: hypothetical protein AAGF48_08200 [Pseudomonadota bacterium]
MAGLLNLVAIASLPFLLAIVMPGWRSLGVYSVLFAIAVLFVTPIFVDAITEPQDGAGAGLGIAVLVYLLLGFSLGLLGIVIRAVRLYSRRKVRV